MVWDRKVGFVSKSLVSRERSVIVRVLQTFLLSPKGTVPQSAQRLGGTKPSIQCHKYVLGLVRFTRAFCFLSYVWPVTSQCFAFVCLTLNLDS